MIRQIISANPEEKKVFQKDGSNFLRISEFYCNTIQGEGRYIGQPAAFLRLQGCALDCEYCDTAIIWKHGNPYTYTELIELIELHGLQNKLVDGQHLILTGGSPLLQQVQLRQFLIRFRGHFGFSPFIEIENECVIMPDPGVSSFINCWNNSPKLSNSGIDFDKRYKPDVIKYTSGYQNSWFKFVISEEKQWQEIEDLFLVPRLIKKNQIILMPEGRSRIEIEDKRDLVLRLAVSHGVRYSTREHIILWDAKVGT